jgi:ribosomal protein S18 acetylase RimI-like enzyme
MEENRYRLEHSTFYDLDFLFQVYASTREEEMALKAWDEETKDQYLHLQFKLQNTQFHHRYPKASYDIIYRGGEGIGRLYVNRTKEEIRVVDISLLTAFRGRGFGTRILRDLIAEAEAAGLPLRLSCERTNRALNLFKRLGFNVVGEAGIFYAMERPNPGLLQKTK